MQQKRMAAIAAILWVAVTIALRRSGGAEAPSDDLNKPPPEGNGTVTKGKERIVPAFADIGAGFEGCAALTNDDGAGLCGLATVQLYATILRVAVTVVPRRALALLMCHDTAPEGNPNVYSVALLYVSNKFNVAL